MKEINKIEDYINTLVRIQDNIITEYESMDTTNYNNHFNNIQKLIQDEKDTLFLIKYQLNQLFNIKYSLIDFKQFRIHEDGYGEYKIKEPLFFTQQKSMEYVLLKKTLKKLHRKYFLNDGTCEYVFDNDLEKHCWIIPNRASKIKIELKKI